MLLLPCQTHKGAGEWEALLLDVLHWQVIFVIPKMFLIFFKFKRKLLGGLWHWVVRSLLQYFQAVTAKALAPGIVAFITDYDVVDRIIDHPGLTFIAEKPPPSRAFEQVMLLGAED